MSDKATALLVFVGYFVAVFALSGLLMRFEAWSMKPPKDKNSS